MLITAFLCVSILWVVTSSFFRSVCPLEKKDDLFIRAPTKLLVPLSLQTFEFELRGNAAGEI